MADLNAAISRLEQVTARLLRFEATLGQGGAAPAAAGGAAAPAHAAAPAATANGAAPAAGGSPGSGELAAYDKLLAEQLQPFMSNAAAVGGEVLEISKLVEKAFKEQRTVLLVASKAKQPDTAQLQSVLAPVAEPMMAASSLADNRRSPCFQQNKVAAEALQALSWLAYTGPSCGLPQPAQHVAESWNAAEFFANKLLREFRGVDEAQVAWVQALKDLFAGLQKFVRASCPSGLRWNPNGCTSIAAALAAAAGSSPAAAAAAAPPAAAPAAAGRPRGPPPPPPPPPAGMMQEAFAAAAGGSSSSSKPAGGAAPAAAGGMQDVLKSLQQGAGVTAGLRRVTDDMKAKNRAERSGAVPAVAAAAPSGGGTRQPAAAAPAKPPRFELEQERKWVVEWQVGQKELLVNVADPKQSVYIYNCSDCVVQVKGKCNAISIDKCKKTGVVFEDVIASCELVNCSSVQVQCTGTVPTVSVDKCDGVQAYIPHRMAANPDFQVVTAKSSEVNLLVLAANPDAEDVAEHAVPEQFISTFVNGKLVTTAASHGGG
uniref:C-CAP/cofactor C-like domain-containing protein n=1 Tax=Tetradesmus obliquus TaxID=3088 RepID=A0A383VPJ4_TETOB|eukprot:jgi/Sobl393_1/10718/SZX67445.1